MVRSIVFAFTISCFVVACTGRITAGPSRFPIVRSAPPIPMPAPDAVVASEPDGEPAAEPGPAYGPNEDRHWLQPDDYFVAERPWESGWMSVQLAKMKRPPTADSKSQGLFFRLGDSRDIWTQFYWRSRPVTADDLTLGTLVICFEGYRRDNAYRAPRTKDQARPGQWFMGKITDTSDAYKQLIKVATYNCGIDSLRAVTR